VVALGGGLAVTNLSSLGGGSPASASAPALTVAVRLLADRAAAAARSGPSVSPGQWVYRTVSCGTYLYALAWEVIPCSSGTLDTWITAGGTRAAYITGGKLYVGSAALASPTPGKGPGRR